MRNEESPRLVYVIQTTEGPIASAYSLWADEEYAGSSLRAARGTRTSRSKSPARV
jgi:hypothetical protein